MSSAHKASVQLPSGRSGAVSQYLLRWRGNTLEWKFIKWLTPPPQDGLVPPSHLQRVRPPSARHQAAEDACAIDLAAKATH